MTSELRAALEDLDRYAPAATPDALRGSRDLQHMVRDALYVAIRCCIDLAHHVVACEGLNGSVGYRTAFAKLASHGWIDERLGAELAQWAGLRNVLAHQHADLDWERVVHAMGQRGRLAAFLQSVLSRMR